MSQRDHAGGNEQLVSMVPGLTVCGNDDRIGAMNKRVKHGDQFKVMRQLNSCVYPWTMCIIITVLGQVSPLHWMTRCHYLEWQEAMA